ncbi:tRNA pseudouridine(38-40) synthase TruA [Paucilactobacillus suebicus]|uniref:tRNA pseudouridine synthase A n=1 Tax=Paucilactobacillus suebicus DSM 5007 = KCTC 3549 TaxID=1423807 RepID=A0A0R1W779_9LACO|nr:tRNA pseudouridine(38-40) synthase TruA [Paucilactobacillus suebicus]KRM13343.1 tRNA pseudouridine synthase A [Paucilactobacillus suebicus DSM 5007 = KCTC 3549]
MYRYKIIFAYDGSDFAGFQVQPHQRTVEKTLKIAVNKIAKNPDPAIEVYGSGRTDAGVHALGQVAHFDIPFDLPDDSMRRALNSLLPLDMMVKSAEHVDANFHARYSAHRKLYRYRVSQGEFVDPFKRRYTAHYKYPLDIERMQIAVKDLIGEHDFTSLVASGSQTKSNVRIIYHAQIWRDEHDQEIIFEFEGNGFLYNQVRIMVSLLLEIGNDQRPVNDIPRVLAARDRNQARGTAPASGLYLVEVNYDD